jgi:predicted site-specific integrase-resolvase
MADDKVIWRHDLQAMMAVSSETMRRWIKAGKLPKPDIAMTHKTMGWRVSTLHNCGINIPA